MLNTPTLTRSPPHIDCLAACDNGYWKWTVQGALDLCGIPSGAWRGNLQLVTGKAKPKTQGIS